MFHASSLVIIAYIGNDTMSSITVTVADYPPGQYDITINSTDVYGQTNNTVVSIILTGTQNQYSNFNYLLIFTTIAPTIEVNCSVVELEVFCQTSVDGLKVALTFECSYDNGTREPCK